MNNLLEIKDLNFGYEKRDILKNISFSVKKNDFITIIGPNGGGKSTLLKLIIGILKPRSGDILYLGKSPSKNIDSIGYVPQEIGVNKNFPISVLDVVLMGLCNKKRSIFGYKKTDILLAKESLKKVNMSGYENRKIGSLSGGQRQRVFIARALVSSPTLVLLDEPTSNIDPAGQIQIVNLLKDLSREITVIVVSHDIRLLLGYSNKVLYVNQEAIIHLAPDVDFLPIDSCCETKNNHICEVDILNALRDMGFTK